MTKIKSKRPPNTYPSLKNYSFCTTRMEQTTWTRTAKTKCMVSCFTTQPSTCAKSLKLRLTLRTQNKMCFSSRSGSAWFCTWSTKSKSGTQTRVAKFYKSKTKEPNCNALKSPSRCFRIRKM